MRLNKKYTVLWVLWLVIFAVLEGGALLNPGTGDTLTENIRQWLALSSREKWLGRFVLACFLAWMSHHFLRPKKEE